MVSIGGKREGIRPDMDQIGENVKRSTRIESQETTKIGPKNNDRQISRL